MQSCLQLLCTRVLQEFSTQKMAKFAQKARANAYVNTPYVEPVEFSPQRYSLEALSPLWR